MDIIHLLPETVASQIHAGEVVTRPASVVKELLENSIDAGATSIQVILQNGGRDLIQVIDNGRGMSPTDARMAFEVHATSKIQTHDDLFNLHTFGFRGEALASIASIAEVTLRTRTADEEIGTEISIAGKKLVSQQPTACPVGANFEIRNLFFNTPARRKFMKAESTEFKAVKTEIDHVALANPKVEIIVTNNGRTERHLTPGSLRQRIIQLNNKNIDKFLLPVEMDTNIVKVEGFVCSPESLRGNAKFTQNLFVNGRYIYHPALYKSIMSAYDALLTANSKPGYYIFLTVDPNELDVNISPSKTEVRFEHENDCSTFLHSAVHHTLGKFSGLTDIDFDQTDVIDVPPSTVNPTGGKPREPQPQYDHYDPFNQHNPNLKNWEMLYGSFETSRNDTPYTSVSSSIGGGNKQDNTSRMEGEEWQSTTSSRVDGGPQQVEFETATSALTLMTTEQQDEAILDLQAPDNGVEALLAPNARRHMMQIANRFIALPSKQGLLVIDQNRAHVCVLFDRYFSQIEHRRGYSDGLFFPERIELHPDDEPFLQQIMPELEYMGFKLSPADDGAYELTAKPSSLPSNVHVQELINEMIEAAQEERGGVTEDLDRNLALRMARAEAIPAGKVLSDMEMSQLIESLFALKECARTPDGKLVMVQISTNTFANLF